MAVRTAAQRADAFEITRKPRSLWRDAFRRLTRNKMAIASLVVIILIALLAILAPVLPLQDPVSYMSRETDPGGGGTRLPPAWAPGGNIKFLLGTDPAGRDVLSRIIYGAQVSFMVGFIPASIIVVLGILVGMTAGYLGGRVDNLLMRLTDVIYAFPDLLFIIIMISALRGTPFSNIMDGLALIFVSLSIIGWVGIARLVRGQVLSLKEKEFIEAARAIGMSSRRIMFVHLLPNSLAPIIVAATFAIPGFIITEAILSYIGIGVRPPRPTWGGMILDGYTNINVAPHLVWIPAACIALLTLSFTFLGDGLRDALDPRMSD
jgi:ABC-type dipeptide/oligopeptide/nickel transport system permease subunit